MNAVSNPKVINELLFCSRRKLAKVAEQNGLKPAVASVVREHWIRRLTGVCVLCGCRVKRGECPECKTKASSGLELLENLSPKANLAQQRCPSCRRVKIVTAGYILGIIKRGKVFKTQYLCRECRQKKAAKPPVVKKAEHPIPKKDPKATKKVVQPYYTSDAPPPPLTNRPFLALEGLKIEKKG